MHILDAHQGRTRQQPYPFCGGHGQAYSGQQAHGLANEEAAVRERHAEACLACARWGSSLHACTRSCIVQGRPSAYWMLPGHIAQLNNYPSMSAKLSLALHFAFNYPVPLPRTELGGEPVLQHPTKTSCESSSCVPRRPLRLRPWMPRQDAEAAKAATPDAAPAVKHALAAEPAGASMCSNTSMAARPSSFLSACSTCIRMADPWSGRRFSGVAPARPLRFKGINAAKNLRDALRRRCCVAGYE